MDRKRLTAGEWGALAFTACYMLVAVAGLVIRRDGEFVFYAVVMALLIALVTRFHLRVRLHVACLWGLALWGLAHMAGGLAEVPASWAVAGEKRVLYNWWLVEGWLKYDQVVHAFGFGLVTWVAWQYLKREFERQNIRLRPRIGLLVWSAAAGIGAGALNEVVEFAAFQLLPDTNVGDYENTGWDLVANLVGAITAALVIYVLDRPEKTG
jgi:hypothetical protein